eukprot:scaffold3416_cov120-Cylindrotheca_fusiformis.AAC.6
MTYPTKPHASSITATKRCSVHKRAIIPSSLIGTKKKIKYSSSSRIYNDTTITTTTTTTINEQ